MPNPETDKTSSDDKQQTTCDKLREMLGQEPRKPGETSMCDKTAAFFAPVADRAKAGVDRAKQAYDDWASPTKDGQSDQDCPRPGKPS